MTDRDFLIWIHGRLAKVHGEREIFDYMHKLRAIIASTPANQETPSDGRGKNGMEALEKALRDPASLRLNASLRWILTTEELPDDETRVLIATADGDVDTAFHEEDVWKWDSTGEEIQIDIIAWSDLPASPKAVPL